MKKPKSTSASLVGTAIVGWSRANTDSIPIVRTNPVRRHRNARGKVYLDVTGFSNPAPFIAGVGVIAHSGTEEAVVQAVEGLVPRTGKLTARVNDKAGFVLNRLQYVLLREAVNLVEEGVATPEDVDVIVRTTFGYRLPFFGPFAIADMAGLDVYRDGFRTLEAHYGKRLAVPALLTELVESGRYGVKQGGGFVTPAGDQAPLSCLPQHRLRPAGAAVAGARPRAARITVERLPAHRGGEATDDNCPLHRWDLADRRRHVAFWGQGLPGQAHSRRRA